MAVSAALAGDEDDRDARVDLPDLSEDVQPGLVGQAQVEEDDVGRVGGGPVPAPRPRSGRPRPGGRAAGNTWRTWSGIRSGSSSMSSRWAMVGSHAGTTAENGWSLYHPSRRWFRLTQPGGRDPEAGLGSDLSLAFDWRRWPPWTVERDSGPDRGTTVAGGTSPAGGHAGSGGLDARTATSPTGWLRRGRAGRPVRAAPPGLFGVRRRPGTGYVLRPSSSALSRRRATRALATLRRLAAVFSTSHYRS